MLKVFRDNLKYLSWVLWLVIAVFVLFVFVDFGAVMPGANAPSQAAVTVGGEEVSFAEFEREYRQLEDRYRQAYGDRFNADLAQQIGLPKQVLDRLVAQKILLLEARRMGLQVGDEEVRRAILEFPAFQEPGGGFVGQETYAAMLRSIGYTPETFEQAMRQDLLIQKLNTILTQNLFVSGQAVEEAYRQQAEAAKIRFLHLPAARFRSQIEVSPEEVESYFQAHREELRLPEQRVVSYLLVDANLMRSNLEVTEGELRRYYEENADSFAQEEQVRARHILLQTGERRSAEAARALLGEARRRIEAGEEFAALARDLSEDPGSKDRGGDLGFFGRGRMVEAFEEAAFGARPGEIVGPVETPFGLHLIQVVERRPGGVPSFEEAEGQVRSRFLAERASSLAEATARELARRIRSEGLTSTRELRELAQDGAAVTFESTPPFGREDNVPGIGRATAFTATAFELAPGAVSDPVELPRGWAILLVEEVREPRLPELDDVRSRVEQAVRRRQALARAVARLEEAKEATRRGAGLAEVARSLGVEVQESGEFGASGGIPGLGLAPGVARAALELEEGHLGGPVEHGDGALLFEVIERRHFDPQEFAARRDEVQAEIERERLNQLLSTLIDRRRRELQVRYNRDLLASFGLLEGVGQTS